eukprot:1195985-Prorocentrum_minimum.AAC.1
MGASAMGDPHLKNQKKTRLTGIPTHPYWKAPEASLSAPLMRPKIASARSRWGHGRPPAGGKNRPKKSAAAVFEPRTTPCNVYQ